MPNGSEQRIELTDFLNVNMHRATRKLTLMFHREVLRPEGLTIQEWRALANLGTYGTCHLRKLSRLARLDASHVSKAALELERKGLIQRHDDARDHRRKQMTVTDEGLATIYRIWPKAMALSARVEALIGKTKYKALNSALLAILEIEDLTLEPSEHVDIAT